jgi:hypothetical protein
MSKTGITVKLIGEDGNAYNILGRVKQAMRRAKVDPAVIAEYMAEATKGDYDHLLLTTMAYVEVE